MKLLLNTLSTWLTVVWYLLTSNSLNTLQKEYDKSIVKIHHRRNETELFIAAARLKPQSNSYIPDAFPEWKSIDSAGSDIKLENATILVLCRNRELDEILESMRSLEDRFNKNYHYPWTFLNDEEFTEEFKEWTSAMASGKTEYGLVRPEDWNTPDFIDQEKYEKCLKDYDERGIIYGWSKSYRNMCHYNSGYFFKQELTLKYDYYFRVEPGVQYYCDFQMDPFRLMRENKKKYGFTVSFYEYPNTIPTLFKTVKEFMELHPEHLHSNNALEFITNKDPINNNHWLIDEPGAEDYNMCHFWSNFEIGDLNFFRSKEYTDFFEYLSRAGGFYYERWGDAPVHSIAVSLLLDKDEIHHFEDIGYYHLPFRTFPTSKSIQMNKRCLIRRSAEDYKTDTKASVIDESEITDIGLTGHGCISRWWKFGSGKRFIREYFHESDYIEE